MIEQIFLVHDTYGDPSQTSGMQQTVFGFTGQVKDDNQLLYLRARYYNPLLGQFFSLDPIETLNRYAYVMGNVTNRRDPSGLLMDRPERWNSCDGKSQQDMPCPDARDYVLPPTNHSTIDNTYASASAFLLFFQSDEDRSQKARQQGTLFAAAERARAVGNIHAANNLEHWLYGSGAPVDNYDVETMLKELPAFVSYISDILGSSVGSLVVNHPELSQQYGSNCRTWKWNTSNTGKWQRVGKASKVAQTDFDIYPHINNDLSPENGTSKSFEMLISETNFQPRAEFDWYVAMNAFNFDLAEGVVIDINTRMGKVCYQVYIEDRFAWYINEGTGFVDAYMYQAELIGVGQNYGISGHSAIRCETFNIDAYNKGGDPRYRFDGPIK